MTQPPDPNNLDWDVEEHGGMAEHATGPEDEPQTKPYQDEPYQDEPAEGDG
jgi:hypothetical protein